VAGATVGTGLGVGLGDGVTVGVVVGLGDGLRDGLTVGLGDELGEGLALELAVGVGEPDAPGEIGGGVAEGADPEHAETAAEPIIAKAQPAMVNFALRPFPMTVVL
jgi:hypothetical protein